MACEIVRSAHDDKVGAACSSLLLFFLLRSFRFAVFLCRSLASCKHSHIRNVNRSFTLGDLPARVILRFAQMFFNHPHAFDEHPIFLRDDLKDLPSRTTKFPVNHLHLAAFFYILLRAIHKTSGASETIFMKLRSRSSRATGPKMRVPRGFKSLSMITMALLSKGRTEPSSRLIGCRVRTRTAGTTWPFLTVSVALASSTFAPILSP